MQIHFDVDQIIKIKMWGERPSDFYYCEAEPIKNWFGFNTGEFTKEGWKEYPNYIGYYSPIYTAEELTKKGYIVYPEKKKVMERPLVEVYLAHDYKVSQTFLKEQEALNWIDDLKAMTGRSGSFEVIIK